MVRVPEILIMLKVNNLYSIKIVVQNLQIKNSVRLKEMTLSLILLLIRNKFKSKPRVVESKTTSED